MQKIQYIRNYNDKNAGDIEIVGNNIAHGLIEKGIAILYRNKMFRSPMDKMMRSETRAERRARQRAEAGRKLGDKYKVK